MKKIVFALVLGLLSCSEDPEESISYLTVEVDPMLSTADTDNWIVVHDMNGVFLEAKSYESGETLDFKSNQPPEAITVTLINEFVYSPTVLVRSFVRQKTNRRWVIRNHMPAALGGDEIGTFSVSLPPSGIQSETAMLTDRFSNWGSVFPGSLSKKIRENARDLLLVATDDEGNARFKFFDNAEPGEVILSLEDMSFFEHSTFLSFPPTKNVLLMTGGMDRAGLTEQFAYSVDYLHNESPSDEERSSVSIHHTDRLINYITVFNAHYENKTLGYNAIGPWSGLGVTITDMDVAIADRSFENFSLTGDGYDYYSAQWRSTTLQEEQPTAYWSVFAAQGDHPNLSLTFPPDVVNEVPALKSLQLEFVQATVTKSTRTFEDEMRIWNEAAPLEPYQSWWKMMF